MKLPTIKFLYDDEFLFAVEKPPLLHSVELPGRRGTQDSLAGRLIQWMPSLGQVATKPEDAGLLQRLDFETSGVILGAKRAEIWRALKSQFEEGRAKKSYLIVAEGLFPPSAHLKNFIGSRYRGSKKVTVSDRLAARSLEAETNFELLKKLAAPEVSLVRAFAANARRHQVRAHAAKLGFPLLGDKLYGARRGVAELFPEQLKVEETPAFLLHAESITFHHPATNQEIALTAGLPRYFQLLGF